MPSFPARFYPRPMAEVGVLQAASAGRASIGPKLLSATATASCHSSLPRTCPLPLLASRRRPRAEYVGQSSLSCSSASWHCSSEAQSSQLLALVGMRSLAPYRTVPEIHQILSLRCHHRQLTWASSILPLLVSVFKLCSIREIILFEGRARAA
eukprot:SAG31_NODE_144_length_22617_cov_21.520117_6_plen_153_part_00